MAELWGLSNGEVLPFNLSWGCLFDKVIQLMASDSFTGKDIKLAKQLGSKAPHFNS
jgi:hypothetical protein